MLSVPASHNQPLRESVMASEPDRTAESVGAYQARSALVKNFEILSPDKDAVLWNFNTVLLYMLSTVERIKYDISNLQKTLRAGLKETSEQQTDEGSRNLYRSPNSPK